MHITLITLIGFSRSKRRDISAWRKSDIHDNKWEPIACKLQLFKKHEFGFTILNAFDNFKAVIFSFYISNLLTILRKAAKIRGRKNLN